MLSDIPCMGEVTTRYFIPITSIRIILITEFRTIIMKESMYYLAMYIRRLDRSFLS